jgi:hypothetical protein
MTAPPAPLPLLTARWVNSDGSPSLIWRQYLLSSDATLRPLARAIVGPLVSAANDAAAATAGVVVGGLYQNAGAVRIRLV